MKIVFLVKKFLINAKKHVVSKPTNIAMRKPNSTSLLNK